MSDSEKNRAIDAGRRAVALEPMDATFRLQLGRPLAQADRLGEAEHVFSEALTLAPDGIAIRQALEQVRVRRAELPTQKVPTEAAPSAASRRSEGSQRLPRRAAKRRAQRQHGL